jgi:hypothetical protein
MAQVNNQGRKFAQSGHAASRTSHPLYKSFKLFSLRLCFFFIDREKIGPLAVWPDSVGKKSPN